MKDSFLFNISNKEGLPGGANEQTNNILGAMSITEHVGPRASTNEDIDQDAMLGMMKARMAYEEMHGNPAAKRMVVAPDNPYQFDNGDTGTHYMGSYGDYAVPNIQEVDGKLEMTGPIANEEMKFDRPEDAAYFSENYKKIAPDSSYREFEELELTDDEIEEYRAGGYVVEEFDKGGSNKDDELITYKNNKKLIDGVANWDMQSDVNITSDYNDQIKARLLTGKFGYNPKTGELVKLGKSEQTKVTDKEALQTKEDLTSTKRMSSKEYEIFQDNEKEAAKQKLMDDYTANRKLVSKDKAAEWNPSFVIKDEYGRDINTQDFAGKQVYMTDAEHDAYKKARIGHNAPIMQNKMNNAFRAAASFTPIGMGINAIEGATRLTQDVPKLIKDPSLANAGNVIMDGLMVAPFVPAAAGKAKPLVTNYLDELSNSTGQSFGSGYGTIVDDVRSGINELRYAAGSKSKIPVEKGLKYKYSRVPERLDHIKGTGQYWDEVGIAGNEITHPDMLTYRGTRTGRPVVDIKMPDGSTASFYKSSGWAGKEGAGKAGTTEGLWQPFGGFSDSPVLGKNWFIKDRGYLDWYGSKTYKDMAYSLDDALMKKFGAKNVDELDNMMNFQRMNRPGDDFIPGYPHGGEHNWMNSNYTVKNSYSDDGNTYTELITDRENDSYEYKREKDKTTGDINYFSRKRGTDTWNTAGEEGTTGYRAVTDLFGEDNTGYATSDQRRDFINKELVKRAEERFARENPVTVTGEQTMDFINDYYNSESTKKKEKLQKQAASIYDAVYNTGNTIEVEQTPTKKVEPLGPNSLAAAFSSDLNRQIKEDTERRIAAGEIEDVMMTEAEWEETMSRQRQQNWDDFVSGVQDITGITAAKNLYNKGATQVVGDLANTAADIIGGAGEAIYEAGDYLVGDGSFDMSDKNWITGNEYGSGLDTVLDIASIAPATKLLKAGKYIKPLVSGTTKTLSKGKNAFIKGAQASTDALGDIRLGTVGSQPLTVGDIGNYVHKGLKYKKVAPNTGIGSVDKFTDKWTSGYGILGGMGVDATVRGDNTYSDIFSGNYDPTKSALGRLSINAADDLSLINESRKNASIQNVIDDGYSFGDALKVGINLSPLKMVRGLAGEERLGETLAGAPQAVAKFSKKLTDKSGRIDNKTDYSSPRTVYLGAQRQEGGTVQEQYLTEAEIAALEAQGYRIEDIS